VVDSVTQRQGSAGQSNARKYGRRRALLEAEGSADHFEQATTRLLSDVERAGASRPTITRLRASVAAASDVTRRRAAVWAILAELEALETA
jgi:hypothetical protein